MPLQIIRNDITKLKCDAIVNAANTSLLGGGGVDGMIHRAAGPELLKECRKLGGCQTGKAKITKGYNLPCKYVIHTPGPIWRGGMFGERELLASSYYNSLMLAKEYDCRSIAFPLISTGAYGYPKQEAFKVGAETITEFLENENSDMLVYIVVFDKWSYLISEELFSDIRSYIDDHYVDELHKDKILFSNRNIYEETEIKEPVQDNNTLTKKPSSPSPSPSHKKISSSFKRSIFGEKERSSETYMAAADDVYEDAEMSELSEFLQSIDESFSEMLLRKIDEKGIKDSECYKKANIDRKLFSKIRSDKLYKPSKSTALAFAIALELPLDETKDLLQKAGFALSHSSRSDIIVEYFISRGVYDIFIINEALFSFDQKLLGA